VFSLHRISRLNVHGALVTASAVYTLVISSFEEGSDVRTAPQLRYPLMVYKRALQQRNRVLGTSVQLRIVYDPNS
jgi:hypothetical protein